MKIQDANWEQLLYLAVQKYTAQFPVSQEHVKDTPARVVKSWGEFTSGYLSDPVEILGEGFQDAHGYNQMVHVRDIPIRSVCAHHLLPIVGRAHFAYVPQLRIVGLSKIARFIDVLARRLQIQEILTEQIVEVFQTAIVPHGCAVRIIAHHACMDARGVRVDAPTETTALRGNFMQPATRAEFMR